MPIPVLDTFADARAGVVGPDAMFDDEERRDETPTGDVLDQIGEDAGVNYPHEDEQLEDQKSPIPGGGYLLEEPNEGKIFKSIDREIERQSRLARNRDEEGKHWDRIRDGVQFSILEKTEDQAIFRAVLPPGVEDVPQPIPNKVQDLCNKQVSQILVDAPLPNPKPDGDAEKNRSAMDLAKQFLRSDGDVTGTNDTELYRELLTLNRTRKSAFVYVWIDKTGGGWRPKQKKAHPRATDASKPLYAPQLDANNQPVMGPEGQPVLERTTDAILRYVAEVDGPDGVQEVFTNNPSEAARQWLPKHRRRVIHPNQVRTLPVTATAFEAHSIIVIMYEPLGEAKKRFNELRKMSPAQLKQLVSWRPKRWKSIVPEALRPKNDGLDPSGEVTDDTLFFWYHKWCRITPDYPDGAEIAVTGAAMNGNPSAGFVLLRDTLREDVETEDGTTVPVLMDPPIAQFRSLIDPKKADPFGDTPVAMFGGANEIRAHLYLSVLEDIDVRLHPNTYLTSTSNLTREDLTRRDDTPLEVLTKDDMPTFEQRPQMPTTVPDMLERIEHDMDTGSNLNQTAQALDSQYSESGVAKQVAISQAKVQLAQDWQGFINGVLQYWKIKLQLAQARLTVPQLVKIGGENSAYKQRHFVGADLLGVTAVALMPGSGTMMNPAEKSQHLSVLQNNKWLDPNEAGELARSSMADELGLPPDPHEEHIDRCIADWLDGPPDGWLEQYEANQTLPQRQQQYQQQAQTATEKLVAVFVSRGMDPQTAQRLAADQVTQQLGKAPQPYQLYTPFEPRANDEEPIVAQRQYTKLSHLMSTVEFTKQPKPWRKLVEDRYQQAAYAAGVKTVRQQEQAQAAAAQAEKKPDKNDPPEYQALIQATTKSVIQKMQQLVAAEVSAIGQSTTVAEKEKATAVPEMLDATHESAEAEKDRQHEHTMEAHKHANAMEQIAAKALATGLTKPAGAEKKAPSTSTE